jgi:hypothetical protein
MRRWLVVLAVTGPLWVVHGMDSSLTMDGQCCTPPTLFAASSFTYDVSFLGSIGTQQERDDFVANAQAAAGRWHDEFQSRNQGVTVAFSTASPTLVVKVDDQYSGDPYWCSTTPPFNASPCNCTANEIVVSPNWVTSLGADQVTADLQHEFGHQLGYDQASAGSGRRAPGLM